MFFGKVAIHKGKPTTCNTDSLTDRELFRVCKSIMMGTIRSNTKVEDLVGLIENKDFREQIQDSIDHLAGKKKSDDKVADFKDTEEVSVKVEEIITEEEVDVESEQEDTEAEDEEVADESEIADTETKEDFTGQESPLDINGLLDGTVSEIKARLADMILSEEEKLEVMEAEQNGKNRSSVIDLIS